ncbi:hypothetical protein INP83_11070 [Mucilaginibacter sp. 21P]|uniref:hypothetical protein n=1 Tax=Mucilaginibacter sp. 21P TaxID=2778902 RepID=UPI001C57C6DA|nr:hypothetical protein [Mucilaginibacter sp. 21P]QXV63656.1 hypothetical protein INP83_11070 [Mucilaginibacter sp. 21P]
MNIEEISFLMQHAVHRGSAKAVDQCGAITALVSKAEAYRIYGRSNVDRWLKEGLISPMKKPGEKSKLFLDRKKLAGIAAASNRHTYLPVADRKL